jgi:hypothetical protein
VLVATLVIGAVLGVLGAGALERRQRDRIEAIGRPRGFAEHMEQVIAPHDSAQRARILPVIQATIERNERIVRGTNDALRASIDSMRAALDPMLDPEQRDRLADVTRRLPPVGLGRPGGPPPDGRRGPPPPGPPPPDGRRGPPPPGPPPPR